MDIFEVGLRHPLRQAVERHIISVYRRVYDARVTLFAPRLYAAFENGTVSCAAGVRTANERFHTECYLDLPAELAASVALGRLVWRSELLEITTLACAQPGDALKFIAGIGQRGRAWGCGFALFTGTASLRKLLTRAGLAIVPIAPADRARVSDRQSWGRYYETDPQVCLTPDSPRLTPALRTPCFSLFRAEPAGRFPAPAAAIHA